MARSNTSFPNSLLPFRKTSWICKSSSSSQSPSLAKIRLCWLSLSGKWVSSGAASMYGPVKTASLVKLYSLNFRQKSPKERVGCNLPLTQQAVLHLTISFSPGNFLKSLSCSNFSPALSRRLVMAASFSDRITPSQSPALAMWRLFLRMTAVSAHEPTVRYTLFSQQFCLKILRKPCSTSSQASVRLFSISFQLERPNFKLEAMRLSRNSFRCLLAYSDCIRAKIQ